MNFSSLRYSTNDRICTITLHRPEKRNALDETLIGELGEALVAASKDPAAKIIILTGSGEAFCAGADLASLKALAAYDFERNLEDSRSLMRLFQLVYTMRKPVIAAVNGTALGGGCGLASVCDIIVAAEEAQFGYPEVRIGFLPALVLVFLSRRIGEGRARALLISGRSFNGTEAVAFGFANEAVPSAKVVQRAHALAAELRDRTSGSSIGLVKEMFAKTYGMTLADALDYAANMNAAARMTDDFRRGLSAFLAKEHITW